jgi:hypothetical protein
MRLSPPGRRDTPDHMSRNHEEVANFSSQEAVTAPSADKGNHLPGTQSPVLSNKVQDPIQSCSVEQFQEEISLQPEVEAGSLLAPEEASQRNPSANASIADLHVTNEAGNNDLPNTSGLRATSEVDELTIPASTEVTIESLPAKIDAMNTVKLEACNDDDIMARHELSRKSISGSSEGCNNGLLSVSLRPAKACPASPPPSKVETLSSSGPDTIPLQNSLSSAPTIPPDLPGAELHPVQPATTSNLELLQNNVKSMPQPEKESLIPNVMEDKLRALPEHADETSQVTTLSQDCELPTNSFKGSTAEISNPQERLDDGEGLTAGLSISTKAVHAVEDVDTGTILPHNSQMRRETSVLSAGLRLSPVNNGQLLEAAHAVSAEFSHVLEQVTQTAAAVPVPPPRSADQQVPPLRMPPTPPPPTPPPTEDAVDHRCSLPSPPPEAREEATPPRPLPPRAPAPPERSSSHSRLNGSSSSNNNSSNNTPTIQRRRIVVRAVETPSPIPFPPSATDEVSRYELDIWIVDQNSGHFARFGSLIFITKHFYSNIVELPRLSPEQDKM